MNPKTKITLWIVITALLDVGSLIVAVFLKPWLIDAEINLVYRNAGFIGFVLFFIAFHAALIYYIHRPFFKSKYFNFSVSVLILILGMAHLFGLTANTMSLMNAGDEPPLPGDAITDQQKDSANYTLIISVSIISLCAYFSFLIYNSWDRQDKFQEIALSQEIKMKIGRWRGKR